MKNSVLYLTQSLIPYSDTVEFNTNFEALDLHPYKVISFFKKKGNFKKYSLWVAAKKGKQFFVKTCSVFDVKNFIGLTREAAIYKILGKIESNQYKDVRVPKFEMKIVKNGFVSLLIEKIDGESITYLPVSKKLEIYVKSIRHIRYLGSKIKEKDRGIFGQRNVLAEAAMYPFLLLASLLSNPKEFKTLIKGAVYFLLNLKNLSRTKKSVLTHRDLHGKNILFNGKKAYVIDWENAVFADSYMEYVVLILSVWKSEYSREIMWKFLKDKKRGAILIIKMATHYLIEKQLPDRKKKEYLEAINWATQF